jgi:vacuolar-type H+-ATPase subunit H
MESDKNLLQEIRAIEEECARRLKEEESQAQQRISKARREAEEIVRRATEEGADAAKRQYDEILDGVRAEIAAFRQNATTDLERVRTSGQENTRAAMQRILQRVGSE